MDTLPPHGKIHCNKCYQRQDVVFDQTKRTEGDWRITANPLAWGNHTAEIVVLGFSKGPTQSGALEKTPHDEIAYKAKRRNVARILSHIGALTIPTGVDPAQYLSAQIGTKEGRFHFGSLVRCTVERYDTKAGKWTGTGGGMLDKFVATPLGHEVAYSCSARYLANLPPQTRLIVMFGLGSKLNYVRECYKLFAATRVEEWRWVNEVAYTDGRIVVVHVEHFASQGALIPQWMGQNEHPRGKYAMQAREAIKQAQS